jgi:hypothetical protein
MADVFTRFHWALIRAPILTTPDRISDSQMYSPPATLSLCLASPFSRNLVVSDPGTYSIARSVTQVHDVTDERDAGAELAIQN